MGRFDAAITLPDPPEPSAPDFRTSLTEWIPRCDPRWGTGGVVPLLAPVLERVPRGSVRAVVACPVRHFKTSTIECAISWWLRKDPTLRVIYMAYSAARASEIGRDIRDVCRRMGVTPVKDFDTIAQWRNDHGGGVSVMSAQQSRLGADVDILVIDDPFESAAECDKAEVRAAVDGTISHYTSRLSVGGSCVLVMSPWRPDDALGVRKDRGWEVVERSAIEVIDGVEIALDPNVRTVEQLHAIRKELQQEDPTERTWFSQWQCKPFVADADLFKSPGSYETLPTFPGWRDAIGADLSYSSKKSADWFSICVIRSWGATAYIRSLVRFKADESIGEQRLREAMAMCPGTPVFSYMSGPELGVAHNYQRKGIPMMPLPARFSKLIRARRTIDRWNQNNILFPWSMPDRVAITGRFRNWKGHDGDVDDEIDCLVSACDGLFSSGPTSPIKTMGRPRWT
jgi:hypothetical protein